MVIVIEFDTDWIDWTFFGWIKIIYLYTVQCLYIDLLIAF